MRELLFLGIFVGLSLVMQIFFLRVSRDILEIHEEDPRFKKMVRMIYVNLVFYIGLIVLLFRAMIMKM